jgi:hypothetical protein
MTTNFLLSVIVFQAMCTPVPPRVYRPRALHDGHARFG